MFKASQRVDEFVDSIRNSISEDEDTEQLKDIIQRKKEYFNDNERLWDSELIFRLWRRLFLRMMKEDGFEKQVKEYNNIIRSRNNKDKRKKQFREAYDRAVNSTRKRLQKAEERMRETANEMESQGIRLADLKDSGSSNGRYQKEQALVDDIINSLGCVDNVVDNIDIEEFSESIATKLRGNSIHNRILMRDLLDAVSSTVGVILHADIHMDPMHESWDSTGNNLRLRKNQYLNILNIIEHSNATGEDLRSIMKSDIGFIQIYPYTDSIHGDMIYNSTGTFAAGYEFNDMHEKYIRIIGHTLSDSERLEYRCPLSDIGFRLHNSHRGAFHFKDNLPDELARRALTNYSLVSLLHLQQWYDGVSSEAKKRSREKFKELTDELLKNKSMERERFKKLVEWSDL